MAATAPAAHACRSPPIRHSNPAWAVDNRFRTFSPTAPPPPAIARATFVAVHFDAIQAFVPPRLANALGPSSVAALASTGAATVVTSAPTTVVTAILRSECVHSLGAGQVSLLGEAFVRGVLLTALLRSDVRVHVARHRQVKKPRWPACFTTRICESEWVALP